MRAKNTTSNKTIYPCNFLRFRPRSGLGLVVIGLGIMFAMNVGNAIAPPPSLAQIQPRSIELQRRTDDTYDTFLRRAEAVARAAVQRQFDSNPLSTTATTTIYGKNNGFIAPLLRLHVTRRDWVNLPDPQQWATYFPMTKQLLGFDPEADAPPSP
ncbi:hypothetical protein PN441_11480 [Spirulina major CS-329]|uniref:hypothetical protein n=2 Tax=Spirulinaceae TaxID=1890448 RepID=UPI00232E9AEC|nr:hypothetical protein [Spirulina subsalsa]MDB9493934.1 hypothetical protein [Spirulina subsalsa CS-330]MDB9503693.1 hypothetical protein [Spirulina major CS-329]